MKSLGVIVSRFSVPELHDGHLYLIDTVFSENEQVLVILGDNNAQPTTDYPLPFDIRNGMILEKFRNVFVKKVIDINDDFAWSKRVDLAIQAFLTENGDCEFVTLYGARDSFIPSYKGSFDVREIKSIKSDSGTDVRKWVSENHLELNSFLFRCGMIHSANIRFPTVYPTVDVAIVNEPLTKILLGRKKDKTKYQFIGGFADVGSESYEDDAAREVLEETGALVKDITYVGSHKVDDSRYAKSKDRIKTLLFIATYESGNIEAQDDIEEVHWFALDEKLKDFIINSHKSLLEMLFEKVITPQRRREDEIALFGRGEHYHKVI